jgi:hypothetical protein
VRCSVSTSPVLETTALEALAARRSSHRHGYGSRPVCLSARLAVALAVCLSVEFLILMTWYSGISSPLFGYHLHGLKSEREVQLRTIPYNDCAF